MSNHDEHVQMVKDCETRESKMTDWERGLIQSCRERIDAGRALTPAMIERLDEIWERIT